MRFAVRRSVLIADSPSPIADFVNGIDQAVHRRVIRMECVLSLVNVHNEWDPLEEMIVGVAMANAPPPKCRQGRLSRRPW